MRADPLFRTERDQNDGRKHTYQNAHREAEPSSALFVARALIRLVLDGDAGGGLGGELGVGAALRAAGRAGRVGRTARGGVVVLGRRLVHRGRRGGRLSGGRAWTVVHLEGNGFKHLHELQRGRRGHGGEARMSAPPMVARPKTRAWALR